MSKGSSLFELIKSLSQEEKKHFKKFATRHIKSSDENNYLQLFEVVDQQEIYDEDQVKRKLKNKTFANNLANGKHYLYQSLLRSLRDYYSGKHAFFELEELILNINILQEKSLNNQALTLVKKAKQIASAHHFDLKYLEILFLERRLIRRHKSEKAGATLLERQRESAEMLNTLQAFNELLQLYEATYLLARDRNPKEELGPELQQIVTQLSELEERSTEFKGELLVCYHATWDIIKRLQHKYDDCYFHIQQIIAELEDNPSMIKGNLERYISILNKNILYCHKIGALEELESIFKKLDNIKPNSRKLELIIFNTNNERLRYYLEFNKYQEALKLIPTLVEGLTVFDNELPVFHKLVFYINIAITYILNQEPSTAQEWNLKILNERRVKVRRDVVFLAKTLEVVIFYELGEFNLLTYRLDAYSRFGTGSAAYRKFAKDFTGCMKSMLDTTEKAKKRQILEDFKKKLEAPDELNITGKESILNWVNLRLTYLV